jgi:hypothetical protein
LASHEEVLEAKVKSMAAPNNSFKRQALSGLPLNSNVRPALYGLEPFVKRR